MRWGFLNHLKKARGEIWPKRERRNNTKNYRDEDKKSAINKKLILSILRSVRIWSWSSESISCYQNHYAYERLLYMYVGMYICYTYINLVNSKCATNTMGSCTACYIIYLWCGRILTHIYARELTMTVYIYIYLYIYIYIYACLYVSMCVCLPLDICRWVC